jgi:hypothetical protein
MGTIRIAGRQVFVPGRGISLIANKFHRSMVEVKT